MCTVPKKRLLRAQSTVPNFVTTTKPYQGFSRLGREGANATPTKKLMRFMEAPFKASEYYHR
jgi:hypothetical protein